MPQVLLFSCLVLGKTGITIKYIYSVMLLKMKSACFLLLLVSCTVHAKTILFVASEFPLIAEETSEHEHTGLGVDIVKRIAARLNLDYKIESYPLKRALSMMEHGEADAIIGPYRSSSRDKYLDYSEFPFYVDALTFFANVDLDVDKVWNGNYASLANSHIGLIRGWSYGDEFNAAEPTLAISRLNNAYSCLQMLVLKRIDLCATHQRQVNALIPYNSMFRKLEPLTPAIAINHGYIAFAKNESMSDLKAKFDKEFTSLLQNGEFTKLQAKYNLAPF